MSRCVECGYEMEFRKFYRCFIIVGGPYNGWKHLGTTFYGGMFDKRNQCQLVPTKGSQLSLFFHKTF